MRVACIVVFFTMVCSASCVNSASRYVTHEQLRELLRVPPVDDAPSAAATRSRDLDALVAEAFDAPDVERRAAAAMAAAEARTAPLTAALSAVDRALAVCAENLANGETTAYKRRIVAHDPSGRVAFHPDFEQGSLENTGRPLDVAIQGDGMLCIALPGGVGYTRNGNLFVNHDGEFVVGLGDGYRLEPSVLVPKAATEISITQDGSVEARISGSARKVPVGRLAIVRFQNPERLHRRGGTIYTETQASGPAVDVPLTGLDAPQLLQGFLEASNVDPTRERIRMTFLKNWRDAILRAIDTVK
jgi:flagellar basal body rod protein FlgG